MRLPAGHATRLFVGFSCSIMFLFVFGSLVAYNTEAESSSITRSSIDEYPITIGIPTDQPEKTIEFYKKLGFKTSSGLSGRLDVVSLEKVGTPYKLEICHSKFSETGPLAVSVSGMSFRVDNLGASVERLRSKGLQFIETSAERDGVTYASLKDPNGISIKLFQP
jgi:catechol 2,3-dioxygenase-like lactoylglutathione lyase family enzyme